MPTYPESGVKLIVDTSEALSAVSELQSALDDIQGTSYTATVSAEVDTSSLDDLESELPQDDTVNYTIDTTVEGDTVDDLPLAGDSANVDYTIDEKHKVNGTPVSTDNPDALNMLTQIRNLGVINTVWNVAGSALEFLKAFETFSVEPMLELDDAVAKVNAQTANAIPNASKLIKGIYYDDLGESINQVANLVIKSQQIGAPIDEASRAALAFTKVFKDQDPTVVLDTLNQMVTNKLAPNFKEAGDLLTTAFQNGGNRGQDLLNTITKNATAFHDLGFTGKDMLGAIVDGLNKGFSSGDQVANVFLKIKQNVQGAAGNDTSQVTKQLEKLGIPNPADSGKAWSTEFVAEVIKGIQDAPVSDSEKEKMLGDILGDKFTGKSFSALMQLSPADWDSVFVNAKGSSDKAASDIDNSLHGAVDHFTLEVQSAIQDWLSSSAVDLPGKITKLKDGLRDGLKVLQEGGSIQDAITVSLKPVGLDTAFEHFESVLGNFVISILQAVSTIQALSGNTTGAAQTQAQVSQLSQKQLTFDLKVGNKEELQEAIATAVSRGVKPEDIAKSAGQAVNELIKSGSTQAAQDLVNSIGEMGGAFGSHGVGVQAEIKPVIPKEQIDALQKQLDTVMNEQKREQIADIKDASLTVSNTIKPQIDTLKTDATAATIPVGNLANSYKGSGDAAAKTKPHLDGQSSATGSVGVSADIATVALDTMSVSIGKVAIAANDLDAAASHVADVQGTLNGTGGGSSAGVGTHATGGSFTGTSVVGEGGREIVSSNANVAVLNNMTTERLFAALQSFVPGASGGGGGSVNNTIINQNSIPNIAVADALGYSQAATLRGMRN